MMLPMVRSIQRIETLFSSCEHVIRTPMKSTKCLIHSSSQRHITVNDTNIHQLCSDKDIAEWIIKTIKPTANRLKHLVSLPDRTPLWKFRKTAESPASFLYGSVHTTDLWNLPVRQQVENAIRQSDTLAFEIAADTHSSGYTEVDKIYDKALQPSISDILHELSPVAVARLKAFSEILRCSFTDVLKYPLCNTPDLMSCSVLVSAGFKAQDMESSVKDFANPGDQGFFSLETVESRRELVAYEVATLEQVKPFLNWALENFDQYSSKIADIQSNRRLPVTPQKICRSPLEQKIMKRRNEMMVTRLEQWANENPEKSCFAMVGAAHLFGPDNMISMLKKQGWTLTYNQESHPIEIRGETHENL